MRIQKSVSIEEDLLRWMEKKAEESRISFSDVLNQELSKLKDGVKR